VGIVWTPSYLDTLPGNPIGSYWIWRSVPASAVADAIARGGERVADRRSTPRAGVRTFMTRWFGAASFSWEYVGSRAASGSSSYSYVVPTTGDSIGGSNPLTGFLVEANSATSSAFWDSAPDSGYSVDNLAPAAPAPFAGTYSAGVAHLHWRPDSEIDLANYRLYRGTSSGFTRSPANRVATPTDTSYADATGATYYYKLSAIDIHGNEGGSTTLLPAGALMPRAPTCRRRWHSSRRVRIPRPGRRPCAFHSPVRAG